MRSSLSVDVCVAVIPDFRDATNGPSTRHSVDQCPSLVIAAELYRGIFRHVHALLRTMASHHIASTSSVTLPRTCNIQVSSNLLFPCLIARYPLTPQPATSNVAKIKTAIMRVLCRVHHSLSTPYLSRRASEPNGM